MKEYIARDPRTGFPLRAGATRTRIQVDEAYRPSAGPWDAIKHYDILPLSIGAKSALEVSWIGRPHLVSQVDGIKALPRISKRNPVETHEALISALSELKPELRSAGLFALPYLALTNPEDLFEHLAELVDDIDTEVRVAASDCLKIVAPVFPSATEHILYGELRSDVNSRNAAAFAALKEMCKVWPEVVVIHLDELLRLDDPSLRAKAAAMLPPLSRSKSAAVWDLIGWSLQDENDEVRAHAARTLTTLANKAPSIARVLLEVALFDESDKVRRPALRAMNSMDMSGYRMNKLCIDGAHHSDVEIRRACIKMIPKLFIESEMRIQANELLRQETDSQLIELLNDMAFDPELDGGEQDKNRYLAPALPVTLEDGTVLPASAFDLDESGQPMFASQPQPANQMLPAPDRDAGEAGPAMGGNEEVRNEVIDDVEFDPARDDYDEEFDAEPDDVDAKPSDD